MRKRFVGIIGICMAVFMTGCGGSTSSSNETPEQKEVRGLAEKYVKACNEEKAADILAISTKDTIKFLSSKNQRCNEGSELSMSEKPILVDSYHPQKGDIKQGDEGTLMASVMLVRKNPTAQEQQIAELAYKEVNFIKTKDGWKFYIPLEESRRLH